MAIATLTIDIVAKLGELQAGFDRAAQIAERSSGRIEGLFSKLGKIGIAAIAFEGARRKVEEFLESIEKLDSLSERAQSLAVPADFLSALDLTAKAAGVDDIDKALTKFTATLADARTGSEKAQRVVAALGISIDDVRKGSISVEQAFRRAADTVSTYADGFEKGNLVQEAFGAKNQKLIALLNEGGEALDRFGGASTETIEKAARLAGEIDKLSAAWERLKLTTAGNIAPFFTSLLDAINGGDGKSISQQIDDANGALEYFRGQLAQLEATAKAPRGLLGQIFGGDPGKDIAAVKGEITRITKLRDDLVDRLTEGQTIKGRAPDVGDKQKSEGQSFLEQLQKRVELQQAGEFAALRVEAAQKKVAAAAEPYIAKLQQIKDLQQSIELFIRDAQRAEQARAEEQDFERGLQQRVRDLQAEGDAIGQTTLAQQKLNAARAIAAQLDARLRAAGDDKGAISRALDAADAARAAAFRALDDNAIKAQSQSLDELLREIEDETRLVGAGNAERQRAVLLRQLEKAGIDSTSDAYAALIEKIEAVGRAIKLEDEVRRQQQAFDDLGAAIAGNIENAIVKFEAFRNLLNAIEQYILRIITRNLVTEPLGNWLSALLKGASGGSIGGAFSDFGGFLGRLFGGPKAAGGPVSAGTAYLVGERGPELFMPRQSGRIVPNGAGGVTHITVNIAGSATRETANQVAAAVGRRLAIANARAF